MDVFRAVDLVTHPHIIEEGQRFKLEDRVKAQRTMVGL
jgi:hypothetical protein